MQPIQREKSISQVFEKKKKMMMMSMKKNVQFVVEKFSQVVQSKTETDYKKSAVSQLVHQPEPRFAVGLI